MNFQNNRMKNRTATSTTTRLIVNADDFAYYDCVSRGILRLAHAGIVTATGIMANSSYFDSHAMWLRDYEDLDVGVHLNLTAGEALSPVLRKERGRYGGRLPGKYAVVKAVMGGALTVEAVKSEWRAQIERCLAKGLKISFLNSHEHIHMLPQLFPIVQNLAREYSIPHIRFVTPELSREWTLGAVIRAGLIELLAIYNRHRLDRSSLRFLGLGPSGRLDLGYLRRRLAKLESGEVYELMCHPGYFDGKEINDPRLLAYHDWEGEMQTLASPEFRKLLDAYGIRLIGYRHLEVKETRLIARMEVETP